MKRTLLSLSWLALLVFAAGVVFMADSVNLKPPKGHSRAEFSDARGNGFR